METNNFVDENSDSIPQPEFEVITTNCSNSAAEVEDVLKNVPEQYLEEETRSQSHYNDDEEDDENDEDYDEDLDEADEDDDDFDDDTSVCTTPSSLQNCRGAKAKRQRREQNEIVNPLAIEICSNDLSKTKHDATDLQTCESSVVEDEGMVKKIKLSNLSQHFNINLENNVKTPSNSSEKKTQPRSSTPKSRDYVALQKSINESKILTEFVTDRELEQPRKLRTKEAVRHISTATSEHSYSNQKRNPSPSKEATNKKIQNKQSKYSLPNNSTVRPKSSYSEDDLRKPCFTKYYAPLKDSKVEKESKSFAGTGRRVSRSRSMSTSVNNTKQQLKLKKWPSDEKIAKRTNMRSENLEFVQKQKDFLQQVKNSGAVETNEVVEIEQKLTDSSVGERIRREKRTRASVAAMDNDRGNGIRRTQDSLLDLSDLQTNPDDESNVTDNHCNSDVDTLEARLMSIWVPPPKVSLNSFENAVVVVRFYLNIFLL